MDEDDDEVVVVFCYPDHAIDGDTLLQLQPHIERAERLFRPDQPSNLEYEIVRQKEIQREMRELEEAWIADFNLYNTEPEGHA